MLWNSSIVNKITVQFFTDIVNVFQTASCHLVEYQKVEDSRVLVSAKKWHESYRSKSDILIGLTMPSQQFKTDGVAISQQFKTDGVAIGISHQSKTDGVAISQQSKTDGSGPYFKTICFSLRFVRLDYQHN